MYFNCYRCGQPGHISAECPAREREAHPPAPPALSRGPEDREHKSVWDKPVPPRRPAWEIADATMHADAIRAAMGWVKSGTEGKRVLAAEQVSEARASRLLA